MTDLDKIDKHKYDYLEFEKEKYSFNGKQYYCSGCGSFPVEFMEYGERKVFYCSNCREAKYLILPEEYEKLYGENPKDF